MTDRRPLPPGTRVIVTVDTYVSWIDDEEQVSRKVRHGTVGVISGSKPSKFIPLEYKVRFEEGECYIWEASLVRNVGSNYLLARIDYLESRICDLENELDNLRD